MLMAWVCVDRLVPSAWTGLIPCSYNVSARWFAMPFKDTLHHPYNCPCFWRKHFYTPSIIMCVCMCVSVIYHSFLWSSHTAPLIINRLMPGQLFIPTLIAVITCINYLVLCVHSRGLPIRPACPSPSAYVNLIYIIMHSCLLPVYTSQLVC